MDRTPAFLTCRWAAMTLFQPYPLWLTSEDTPWCCVRLSVGRPLETTEMCRACRNWTPRIDAEVFSHDNPTRH